MPAKKTAAPRKTATAPRKTATAPAVDQVSPEITAALADPAFVRGLGIVNGDDESKIIERARAALGL